MDSILVICYSYTGTSRRLTELVRAQRGWPVGYVIEERPRSGTSGLIRCVLDSLLQRRPAIRYDGPDPSNFRTVVLVAPVWIGKLAGPMRSFVAEYRGEISRIALLLTMGERGGSNAAAEVASILGRDPVLFEAVATREVEDGSCAAAVDAFGRALQPPGPAEPVRQAMWSPQAG